MPLAIQGLWVGRALGTNSGHVYLELVQQDLQVTGRLKFSDDRFGLETFDVTGSVEPEIRLALTPAPSDPNPGRSTGHLIGHVRNDGVLEGTWGMDSGTSGVFEVSRANVGASIGAQALSAPPKIVQLYNKEASLGAVRLARQDLPGLFDAVHKLFNGAAAVVTYKLNGRTINTMSPEFLANPPRTNTALTDVRISVQEPEPSNRAFSRSVTITLAPISGSQLVATSIDDVWCDGATESLRRQFSQYESRALTLYRKYGLEPNGMLLLAMIAITPAIETTLARIQFVSLVFLLLNNLTSIMDHWKRAT